MPFIYTHPSWEEVRNMSESQYTKAVIFSMLASSAIGIIIAVILAVLF